MYCDLWSQYIQVRKLFKGGKYSRAETIRGNTVVRKSVRNSSYTALNFMMCQIEDYGRPMKAKSNIIQIFCPKSATSHSLKFGMLEQHSHQRFCHGASVVDVFNQKVQTKIKSNNWKKNQSADCPRSYWSIQTFIALRNHICISKRMGMLLCILCQLS